MSREIIYLGHNNTIDWQLQADGVAIDLAAVTRMTLEIDSQTLDSATDGNGSGNPFYWTTGVPATGVANLFLTLGSAAETAGVSTGNHTVALTVYDPSHPDGLVWVGSEPVTVV